MIIALDVDEVVLDLLPTWISLYNAESGDNLDYKTIDDWNTSKFVKPEFKDRIFEYIEYPDVFLGSLPVKGALGVVKYLKKIGHRVIFVTANNPDNCKIEWLKTHGFLERNEDFVQSFDKSLILADVLIDDKYENCRDFKGKAFLLNKPYNLKYEFNDRVDNFIDFVKKVEEYAINFGR